MKPCATCLPVRLRHMAFKSNRSICTECLRPWMPNANTGLPIGWAIVKQLDSSSLWNEARYQNYRTVLKVYTHRHLLWFGYISWRLEETLAKKEITLHWAAAEITKRRRTQLKRWISSVKMHVKSIHGFHHQGRRQDPEWQEIVSPQTHNEGMGIQPSSTSSSLGELPPRFRLIQVYLQYLQRDR